MLQLLNNFSETKVSKRTYSCIFNQSVEVLFIIEGFFSKTILTMDSSNHGGNGQMGTLGLVSVLVGGVGDGVSLAIIGHKGIGTLDVESLLISSNVLQLSGGLSRGSIAGLVANQEQRVRKQILVT